MRVIYASDGTHNAARSARSGLTGAHARTYIRRISGELVEAPNFGDLELAPGDSIVGVSCGGGGYRPPAERDPERVRHDVVEGHVSRERARGVYRVVIDANGQVNEAATTASRASSTSTCLARTTRGDS